MGLNTGISVIDDLSNIGIKDIFAYQAQQNQLKIDQGLAETSNYVAKLNAQAALLNGQVRAAQEQAALNSGAWLTNKWVWVGAAVGFGVLVYMVKK